MPRRPTPAPLRAAAVLAAAGALVAASVVAVSGGAGVAAAATPAGPVTTSELTAVPASGVFALEGHGFGHGHGLSQWGAQGAAEVGVSLTTLLGHYYPGTSLTQQAASSVRVALSGLAAGGTAFWAAQGLTVTDAAGTSTTPPSDAQHARLRLVAGSGSSLTLQSSPDGSSWATEADGLQAPVAVADSASLIRVAESDGSSRGYHGSLSVTATRAVNDVDLEDYVQDVVPREASSGWLPTALQAQAVAARTYASYEVQHAGSTATYDICDTTACQVYGGAAAYTSSGNATSLEAASTTNATQATAGQVLDYDGQAAFTQFSASNGGYSSDGGQPYLPAEPDPWDGVDGGNTGHSWTAQLSAAQLQKAFPSVGTLTALEVTQRDGYGDWGGRVLHAVLHGVSSAGAPTAVTVSGQDLLNADTWPSASSGLRSTWFHVIGAPVTPGSAPAQGVGLQRIAPTTLLNSSRLASTAPKRLQVAGRGGVPAGVVGVFVTASAGRLSGASVADLQAWPVAGNRAAAVRFASLSSTGPAAGSAVIPVGPDGGIDVAPSHGRVGLQLAVTGYEVAGGPGLVTLSHPVTAYSGPVSGKRAVTLSHAPAGTLAALVAVTGGAAGAAGAAPRGGLTVAGAPSMTIAATPQTVTELVPLSVTLAASKAHVRVQVLAWAVTGAPMLTPADYVAHGSAGAHSGLLKLGTPSGATQALTLVTARGSKSGDLALWPHATSGPGPLLALPAGRATTVLVVTSLKDGRLVVTPPRTPVTLTAATLARV